MFLCGESEYSGGKGQYRLIVTIGIGVRYGSNWLHWDWE